MLTVSTDFGKKIQFNDPENEFLMVDKVFSKKVSCSTNADCYEFLLNNDDYRSLAPEFEPYLNCEKAQITEVNFDN